MDQSQILALAVQCESHGKSFSSIRTEHGEAVYFAVRDLCVSRGRGKFEAEIAAEDSASGTIILQIGNPQSGDQ